MPKPGALWVLRHSVTGTCQTEKLWHPLLFKRFTDGDCLHRPVVMPRKWGRRSAWQSGSRRNEKKMASVSDFRTLCSNVFFPIEMILIRGILQVNMKQCWENSKKCFSSYVCGSDSGVMTCQSYVRIICLLLTFRQCLVSFFK